MTTGFTQRFKGKIAVVVGGIWQGGLQSMASFVNAGAPTNGTSGTAAGIAPKGAQLTDTTNGIVYQNTGTQASPVWTTVVLNGIGFAATSVTNPVTAAGSTAASATALSSAINVVATVAAGTGVALSNAATIGVGGTQRVYNTTASTALKVYVKDGSTIDGTAGSTGVTLSAASAADFSVLSSTTFKSALLGAVSS